MKRGGRLKRSRLRSVGKGKSGVKELDALCRKLVFLRDGGVCKWCRINYATDWCHVFSRRYTSIRWHPTNSWAGCKGCHLKWHHQPTEGARWIEAEVGAAELRNLRLFIGSKKPIDRVATKLWLEGQIKRMEP